MSDPQFVLLDDMPPTGHEPEVGEKQDRFFKEVEVPPDFASDYLGYLAARALLAQAEHGPITRAFACVRPDSVVVEAFYKAP